MTQATNNPFFGKFKTPFETPPFDQIKVEHYEPAFDEAIKRLDKEVKAIAENPQPPRSRTRSSRWSVADNY